MPENFPTATAESADPTLTPLVILTSQSLILAPSPENRRVPLCIADGLHHPCGGRTRSSCKPTSYASSMTFSQPN